uniref:Uncharacterized protein n=1 Tax=Microplitis mediator bracovirus TaxID=1836595 RepID=A0A2I6SGV5_9VIRU|nr:hypothetical protein MmBV_CMP10 [Microplitis mediator bracovirus]
MCYKFGCIVPREWGSYPTFTVEIILYGELLEQWRSYNRLDSAVVIIGNVVAISEALFPFLWLRRVGDTNLLPNSEYSFLYMTVSTE